MTLNEKAWLLIVLCTFGIIAVLGFALWAAKGTYCWKANRPECCWGCTSSHVYADCLVHALRVYPEQHLGRNGYSVFDINGKRLAWGATESVARQNAAIAKIATEGALEGLTAAAPLLVKTAKKSA